MSGPTERIVLEPKGLEPVTMHELLEARTWLARYYEDRAHGKLVVVPADLLWRILQGLCQDLESEGEAATESDGG